ncbi:MAG: hypothetical protein ACP6IP_02780 [Candidatus Njordarchaeia archaeon]
MNKEAKENILKLIEKLDEIKAKKAKIFLKDLLGASYNWEKSIYKNRLLTLICTSLKEEADNKEFCKKVKKYLDELG